MNPVPTCDAIGPSGHVCTLPRGHEGDHQARTPNGATTLATWTANTTTAAERACVLLERIAVVLERLEQGFAAKPAPPPDRRDGL